MRHDIALIRDPFNTDTIADVIGEFVPADRPFETWIVAHAPNMPICAARKGRFILAQREFENGIATGAALHPTYHVEEADAMRALDRLGKRGHVSGDTF